MWSSTPSITVHSSFMTASCLLRIPAGGLHFFLENQEDFLLIAFTVTEHGKFAAGNHRLV